MPGHHQTLLFQLLGHIPGRGARHLDPGLAEDGARDEHEGDIDGSVDGVQQRLGEIQRGGHVVGNSRRGVELGRAFARFPHAEEPDEEVVGEARVHHLADQEDVGGERGLQHDGHVGGVEKPDWVGASHAALAG